MNIDGSNLSEIFDISNSKTKNASVQGNSAEFAKSTGAFLMEEQDKLNQLWVRHQISQARIVF